MDTSKCERDEMHGPATHQVWADDYKRLGLKPIRVCNGCAVLIAINTRLNVAPLGAGTVAVELRA